MPASADRNLLFGILAAQLDFVTRDALLGAMSAWLLNKAKPLGEILRDQGHLTPERLQLLTALVAEHLKQHGDDAEKSLAALSSLDVRLHRQLASVEDDDVQQSIGHIPSSRPVRDAGQTIDEPRSSAIRYRILRPHARGALGEVFVAEDTELGRSVALKEIQSQRADDPDSRARFVREAEITGGLEHPGIVPVYGLGTYGDGRPFYAMRFIRGDNLLAAIEQFHSSGSPRFDSLEIRQLLRRFIDVCNAIGYSHSRGVLHRDLKPGNIMLGNYGETLVVDWGLARPLGQSHRAGTNAGQCFDEPTLHPRQGRESSETLIGQVFGTPAYMSPEQAAGKIDELGPATDICSLGATLYHLLTGRPTFDDVDLDAVQKGQFPPPRRVNSDVPRPLEAVCLRAMALKPTDRYGSALDLAADIEHWLADEPVTAWREPVGARLRRWVRRHARLVTGIGAALAVGALALGGLAWQRELAREAIAVRERETALERDRAEAAERQVRTEKVVTDAVNNFLVDDLLASATPEKQLGRKITVEDVLQNASARIDGSFTNQPEVAAGIRIALGNSYRKLGLFEPADRHLKAGLDLRRRTLGDAHRDTLAAGADRSRLLADEGKWDEAVPLLRQVVADAQTNFGPDDALTIEATGRLALVLQERGDTTEAEKLFKVALAAARRVFGPTDPRMLTVLNDFGVLLEARKKLPEAEAVFREVADGRAKALAPTHPETLESLNNLAVVLDDEGRWKEAKSLFEKVLAEKRRILPQDHIDTLSTMNNLAFVLRKHGEWDAAHSLYDESYEGFRRVLGRDNPETLKIQNGLGQFYVKLGQETGRADLRAQGVTILQAVLETRRRVLPHEHADTLQSATDLGFALIVQNQLSEAESVLRDALAGRRKSLTPGNPDTLETAINYVQCLKREGKTAEAIAESREVLVAAEREGTAEGPQGIQLLRLLATSLVKDRPDEAVELSKRALFLSRRVFGETGNETVNNRERLCLILMTLGRTTEAESHLRMVYDACRTQGPNSRTAAAARNLGACLVKQQRFADAEPLFIEYYEATSRIQGVSPAVIRAAGQQVVQLYEAWGKPEKATEWREKLK